jgi:GT2 family glycosyltransferase
VKTAMSHQTQLSIVIVNWNSAEYVQTCIESIVTETKAVKYEIVVVDNASFDSCGERLQGSPDVIFVQSQENLGFGGANNFGVQRTSGEVLLFLNPDTEVLNGAIDRLFDRFQHTAKVGILGCRLLNTDRSVQTSCVQAYPTAINQILDIQILRQMVPQWQLWRTDALFSRSDVPAEVEAISGACMMVRRDVFQQLGGFTPAFFMYGEDIDLCAKARHAGLRNTFAGDCEIVHHGGGSSRKIPSTLSVLMMCRAIALVLRRWQGPSASIAYRVGLTISACARLFILALAGPVWLCADGYTSWIGTTRKWLAILGWAVGLNRPVTSAAQMTADLKG